MSYLNLKDRIKVALHTLKCGVIITCIELKGLNIEKKCFSGFTVYCSNCNKTIIDRNYKKPFFYNE